GGLAGVSAIKGIRERDGEGSILLVTEEANLPYNRPPLSKELLLGKEDVADVFVEDDNFYDQEEVAVEMETLITEVNPDEKSIVGEDGISYGYGKLLLATGGYPRKLDIPGGDLEGIIYYRDLEDYKRLHNLIETSKSAIVVGGGFIGSEIAAALNLNDLNVTMVFPESYLLEKIFPKELARSVQRVYEDRGVKILSGKLPEEITKSDGGYTLRTEDGVTSRGDMVIAGIGINPAVDLCKEGNFDVFEGIEVDEHLQTSCPDVFAAGDNAYFPYAALEDCVRVEHWDNALNQGKIAGRNMAGADEPYDYIPYFYSDLYDFGFEALGDVQAHLDTLIDWKEEGKEGVAYYLSDDGKVRGVLLLGVWGKKGHARKLIERKECFREEDLVDAI
ncbi:MAG: NAD(P)/FAD-dependent oxidoreductase, partial [Candidatus Bipolaricaulota bacterium]